LELGSGFNPDFTGRENVYLNGAVLGLRKDDIDTKFNQILEFAEIGQFIDQPVKTYSSGMMVRLAFAVQVQLDPELLIVDEALAVGDVFAMPCRTRRFGLDVEGLGIVYLEASAVGLPVIAGDSGGAPEAVLEGETGYVVPGDSIERTAARCVELLKDPAKAKNGLGQFLP